MPLADRIVTPEDIRRIFNRLEEEAASKSYYPEMLDFDLEENRAAETFEIETYLSWFGVT